MTKNRDFTEEQAKFAFSCADVNEDDKIDISEFVQLFFPSAKEVGPSTRIVIFILSGDRKPEEKLPRPRRCGKEIPTVGREQRWEDLL